MKNFSISRLAGIILKQRKLMQLTQQQLADLSGINRSMLCRLENQEYVPSLDQLTRLANALRFDVADVFVEYTTPVFHPVVTKRITVFGTGYVGLSTATLLARHHMVTLVDAAPESADKINRRISPINDEYLEKHFAKAPLHLTAVTDGASACKDADFVVIAVPTGYDPKNNRFNTSAVEEIIKLVLDHAPGTVIVIKSTVPVGFTSSMRDRFSTDNLLFSPEFLRESHALYDNLYPDRIIVGSNDSTRKKAQTFACLMKSSALKKDISVLLTGTGEAEAVKLFSDTYLALRVSFFNELDSFAETKNLDPRDIIRGVCMDSRIGARCSNPSFGCDDFCLPSNTKQVLANSEHLPLNMITAIVDSNRIRKDHVSDRILQLVDGYTANDGWDKAKEKKIVIGVFRLNMKTSSNSCRNNSIQDIIKRIKAEGATIIIYEPLLDEGVTVFGSKIVNDLKKFKKQSDAIIADCYDPCLNNVKSKVYTRDLVSHGDGSH